MLKESLEPSPTMEYLAGLFKDSGTACIELHGKCQKCKSLVDLVIFESEMEVYGNGGMIVSAEPHPIPEFKCTTCLEEDNYRISPTRCETFSRVCGYLRPINNWNPGKKAEWNERVTYNNSKSLTGNSKL